MKKLSKLKLNMLSDANLRDKEMNGLRGGGNCYCSCYYANSGGSSSDANMGANYDKSGTGQPDVYSTSGCNAYFAGGSGSMYCSNCNESNSGYPIG